jgi:predicted ester cyclase
MGTSEAALSRLHEDVWNGDNPDTADDLVHEEYIVHGRELAAGMQGPNRALASGTRGVSPDMTFTVDDTIAAGERVALRWTMTGTRRGPTFGSEPTGREVELTAIEIDRFADGRLVETWTRSDQFGLIEQLGVDVGLGRVTDGYAPSDVETLRVRRFLRRRRCAGTVARRQ